MSRLPILRVTLTAAVLAICAAPAFAAEFVPQSTTLSTAGLNLNSPQGAALLKARIEGAARAVCGDADTRDMQAMADLKRCRALALESADLQMRAAVVAAHQSARMAAASHTVVSDNTPR